MNTLEKSLAGLAGFIFSLLELFGALLALVAVAVITFAVLRSMWRLTFGKGTLILPFRGADEIKVCVSEILSQQIGQIEKGWRELSRRVRTEQEADKIGNAAMLVDLGRSEPDTVLDSEQEELILSDPLEGQTVGPFQLGPARFSPDAFLSLFYRVRTILARRTIRGGVDRIGKAVRLSTTFTTGRGRKTTTVLIRPVENEEEILDLIDDSAFEIAKDRWGLKSEAKTWRGYRAFLEGYADHVRYIRGGHLLDREKAIEKYQQSVTSESDYHLAHYNLAALLYNRFSASDNDRAIEHLRKAVAAPNEALKALVLGVLTRAYCQQVHRYGHRKEPWLSWAAEASAKAIALAPDLEESWLARGFTEQLLGKPEEALASYHRAMTLPGESAEEKRLKSSAANNCGYIYMTHLKDLQKAEALFTEALERDKYNKFCYANLGEIYKRQKNYKKAMNAFQQALLLDPHYVNGTNELGMLYIAMADDAREEGREPKAVEFLKMAGQCHDRALSLVPEQDHRYRAELGRRFAKQYRQHGFPKEAEALAQRTEPENQSGAG